MCLENVCVSVYVLGMYVCKCVGGFSRVCVFGNVFLGERGCVFFGNVWVGVYGGDSCVCDCVWVMCV